MQVRTPPPASHVEFDRRSLSLWSPFESRHSHDRIGPWLERDAMPSQPRNVEQLIQFRYAEVVVSIFCWEKCSILPQLPIAEPVGAIQQHSNLGYAY